MNWPRLLDRIVGIPLLAPMAFCGQEPLRRKESKPWHLRKILLIKLAAVGDAVLLVPTIKALKQALPDAQIDWLVSTVNQEIAHTVPGINHFWVWDNRGVSGLFGVLKIIRELRAQRYDAVIDFEQWARGSAAIAFFSAAKIRVGFDTPKEHRAPAFTRTKPKRFDQHEMLEFAELAAHLVPVSYADLTLELLETASGIEQLRKIAPQLFDEKNNHKRQSVLIHPGCGRDGLPREWPISKYAALAQWLIQNYSTDIYISAGPEEKWKSQKLNRLLDGKAFDLGGQLSWSATVSLVQRMDLLVSGNTGVMHIGAALHRAQVALHGPTNSVLWGPQNKLARVVRSSCAKCPCLRLGFEYHRLDNACMNLISLEEVQSAVKELI